MNPYKLRSILELVRRHGRLPTDQRDEVLSPDDLLVWFGLRGRLSLSEELIVKGELELMAEAEAFMDSLQCRVV